MNKLPKSTLLKVLMNIGSLYQQGVIDAKQRNTLVDIAKEGVTSGWQELFAAVTEIYDKTGNFAAKNILDLCFNTI